MRVSLLYSNQENIIAIASVPLNQLDVSFKSTDILNYLNAIVIHHIFLTVVGF